MKVFLKLQNNPVFKNGILFTFFSFANSGISFLLLLILSKFISPSGYGELNLFNTFITILTVVISLNTTGIISIDYFTSSEKRLRELINAVFLISTFVLLLFCSILLLFSDYLQIITGLSIKYQWLALLVCYVQVFSAINLDIWRLEEKPILYGIYSMSTVILNAVFTLIAVISLNAGWQGRVYSQVGVGVVFFIVSIFMLIHRKYLTMLYPSNDAFKDAIRFGIPLIPHSISSWLRQGLDRYIINFYHSTSAVGIFSFASNFSNIILIVGSAFNATNSVHIYKLLSSDPVESKNNLLNMTKKMILFFILFTIIINLSAIIFIPVFVPQYIESIHYLFPLCLSALFQCLYLLFVNYIFFYKKTKVLMYITFSMSVLHILLSFIFTKHAVLYTAYITLGVNMLIFLLVFLYSRRLYKLL